jgi:6-phosphogluconolactonase
MCSMDLEVHTSAEESGHALVSALLEQAQDAVENHGYFILGLSGGSIISMLASILPKEPEDMKSYKTKLNFPRFDKWFIILVDERMVPLSSIDSNCGEIERRLLPLLPDLPLSHLFGLRVPDFPEKETDLIDAFLIAKNYEEALHSFYKTLCRDGNGYRNIRAGDFPIVDALILGMGPDGHTASLFPHHDWFEFDMETLVYAIRRPSSPLLHPNHQHTLLQNWTSLIHDAPKAPSTRISLTLPCLISAKKVFFFVSGNEKASAVGQIYEKAVVEPYMWQDVEWLKGLMPAAAVTILRNEVIGPTEWFLDAAAAEKLPKSKAY